MFMVQAVFFGRIAAFVLAVRRLPGRQQRHNTLPARAAPAVVSPP
jgi:hypothetical protein